MIAPAYLAEDPRTMKVPYQSNVRAKKSVSLTLMLPPVSKLERSLLARLSSGRVTSDGATVAVYG